MDPSPGWRTVRLLSATSFLADISGEMLMAVLPFLVIGLAGTGTLGIGVSLGLVAGMSDAVGHIVKLPGGWLGDRVRSKRWLVASGYLLAAGARFGVAYAPTPTTAGAFRSLDRVGKGLRTAPRDAILAGAIPATQRGAAFGLHRAADTAGAVVGVLVALGLVALVGASYSTVVLAAAIVGLFAVIPLLWVREPEEATSTGKVALEPVSRRYVGFLAVSGVFALGQLSYVFFLVRSVSGRASAGAAVEAVLWYLGFNLVYMAASFPIGKWADHVGRERVLGLGFLATGIGSAAFIAQPSVLTLAVGFVVLGLSFAATDSLGRAIAADVAGPQARSTRLGWYHMTIGVATVGGALAAGLLWDRMDPRAAFAWGTGLPIVAALLLVGWTRTRRVTDK